jgi:hypothetical protein
MTYAQAFNTCRSDGDGRLAMFYYDSDVGTATSIIGKLEELVYIGIGKLLDVNHWEIGDSCVTRVYCMHHDQGVL